MINIEVGTNGRNRINGTAADDLIIGLGGNDTIRAGAGDDIIIGFSLGNPAKNEIDTLTGGAGADSFWLAGGYLGDGARGYALITDFSVSQSDRLVLTAGAGYSYQQFSTGTRIFCGTDLVAQLRGVHLGSGVITSSTSWAEFV